MPPKSVKKHLTVHGLPALTGLPKAMKAQEKAGALHQDSEQPAKPAPKRGKRTTRKRASTRSQKAPTPPPAPIPEPKPPKPVEAIREEARAVLDRLLRGVLQ